MYLTDADELGPTMRELHQLAGWKGGASLREAWEDNF